MEKDNDRHWKAAFAAAVLSSAATIALLVAAVNGATAGLIV